MQLRTGVKCNEIQPLPQAGQTHAVFGRFYLGHLLLHYEKYAGCYPSVFWLLTFRFGTGAILLGLFCWKKWGTVFKKDYIWRGGILGAFPLSGLQRPDLWSGIHHAFENAFLTSVYCVLVPFLYWWLAKQRPDRYNILAAVLCVAGVGLVSLNGDLTITIGDLLTLVSALFYALHIVAVNKLSPARTFTSLLSSSLQVRQSCL